MARVIPEQWAIIEEFPDYAVSNQGEVKNLKYGRILKAHLTEYGKHQVMLRKDGKSYGRYVHRLVAEAFISGFDPEYNVKYIPDDDKPYVESLKFRYGTRLGRMVKPETSPEVRRLRIKETGMVFKSVYNAARYLRTDASTIYKVLRGDRERCMGFTFEYVSEML